MSDYRCTEAHPGAWGRACTSLDPDDRAPRAARRWLAEAMTAWQADDIADEAALLVSELVTNAVRHARTNVQLCCLLERSAIRVEVLDLSPAGWVPAPRRAADDAEGGRGLFLAATMATGWGVDYTAAAKRVWFRLERVPPQPARARPGHGHLRVGVLRVRLPECTVLQWNDDAAALFGWSQEQALGASLAELVAWPTSLSRGELLQRLARAPWQGAYSIRHLDGHDTLVAAVHTLVSAPDGSELACLLVPERHAFLLPPRPAGRPAEAETGTAG